MEPLPSEGCFGKRNQGSFQSQGELSHGVRGRFKAGQVALLESQQQVISCALDPYGLFTTPYEFVNLNAITLLEEEKGWE